MRAIVWFRRDLRVHDQPALSAAVRECEEIIPLFIFDDPLLSSRQFGSANVAFMLNCLEDLVKRLQRLKLTFMWRRGDPVEELARAARELKVEVVYWNRDYEPAAIERDRRAVHRLAQLGVTTKTYKDHVVFETRDVLSSKGKPLQRYGAYRRRWWEHWHASPPRLTTPPNARLYREDKDSTRLADTQRPRIRSSIGSMERRGNGRSATPPPIPR